MTTIDKQEIADAYEEVRKDDSAITWLVLKYDDNNLILADKGDNYNDLVSQLADDDRAFAFVRVIMGDELSKRAKFVLITWIGGNVGGLKRAKMGTDKSLVKQVIKSFATEIMTSDIDDLSIDNVKDALQRAGGANYGTGVRE